MDNLLSKKREKDVIYLMEIASGFWASKTLATAVELEIFNQIPQEGIGLDELSKKLKIKSRPAEMLLTGCTSLGLLQKKNTLYYNSPLSEEFLVKGKPYYFGGVVTMLDKREYIPWSRLTDAVKNNERQTGKGASAGLFDDVTADSQEQRIFTEAMHSWSIQSGKELVNAIDFSKYKKLLDVGGGSGAYCIEIAKKFPNIQAVVFDLPSALKITAKKIIDANLSTRIQTYTGNFFTDELPKSSDVILLSMILHDWSTDENLTILQNCYNALPSGGEIIISELMVDDDKTGPVFAALMSLNMLIETTGGQNYTWSEYTDWLTNIGFVDIRRVEISSPASNGVLIGRKP
ncbi:methyltransferase [Bacillus cereus]|uniref:methyltransferase n=1 Tax=Bacillus cereus TaxID=1396 RepID=UPI0018F59021|nr:methyltransferase [Bacillus cereus]MBJ8154341.1 methyltransferase domain-containing protein [Bacillus cereus]